jgi:phosphatidylserine decarboxylase
VIVWCVEVFRVRGKRNPFIAAEGVLPMLVVAAAGVLLMRYTDPWYGLMPGVILVLMYLLFRDPIRATPPVALGVLSPVDGEVVAVATTDKCVVQGEAHVIRIRIDSLGSYTARSPIEGKVMDLHSSVQGVGPDCPANALWVQSDEGEDVVLQFHNYRFGFAPRSFIRFGERIGQGGRCAYLRLAQFAEVYMPIDGKVLVEPGQKVVAGSDVIGTVPHP